MDALKKLIPLIKTVAPALATALGGPLAGTAVSVLSSALGKGSDSSIDELATIISGGSPETLIALKEANTNLKIEMKKLDIDLEQIATDDRDSARKREMVVKDKIPAILAVIIFIGYFVTLAVLFVYGLPKDASQSLVMMIGSMIGVQTTLVAAITTYYFGSSKGSKDKTAQIDRLIK